MKGPVHVDTRTTAPFTLSVPLTTSNTFLWPIDPPNLCWPLATTHRPLRSLSVRIVNMLLPLGTSLGDRLVRIVLVRHPVATTVVYKHRHVADCYIVRVSIANGEVVDSSRRLVHAESRDF